MAYTIKRGRGRPQAEVKTRAMAYVTPKGYKFVKIDRTTNQFVFRKIK